LGADIISSAVPGFPIALKILKGIYDMAEKSSAIGEECARLKAYCGATTASLAQYARLTLTDAASRQLTNASNSLQKLQTILAAQTESTPFVQLFGGSEYKTAAVCAEREVQQAVRSLMELATPDKMANAVEINEKVDRLLKRRSTQPPPPPSSHFFPPLTPSPTAV
jgi:hypothetical protein